MTEPRSAVEVLTDAIWRQTDLGLDVMRRAVERALESLHHDNQQYLIIDTADNHAWWAPHATPLRGIHADRQPFGPARQTIRDWLAHNGLDAMDVVAFGLLTDDRLRIETIVRGARGEILGSGGGMCTHVRDVPLVEAFPDDLTPWLHTLMMRDPDDKETT